MNILLGNLKIEDIIKPEYQDKIKQFLDSNGFTKEPECKLVATKEGNYHIYEIPRVIDICGEHKAQEFVKHIQESNLNSAFIGKIGVTIAQPVSKLKEKENEPE